MSKERRPEGPGWKDRLLEPDALPEWKIADKEAAWDRLYQRLGNPRRRIVAPWYRVAAAAIFLFMMGLTLFLWERSAGPKMSPHPGASVIPPSSPAAHRGSPALPDRRIAGSNNRPVPAQQDRSWAAGLALPKHNRSSVDGPLLRSAMPRIAPSDPGNGIRVAPALLPTDPSSPGRTMGITLQNPVAKKEMRVLSINELDHPPGPGSSMAGSTESKRLGFRWGSHGISDHPISAEEEAGSGRSSTNTLIKINLSPQN
jgi:hypothetical protein